MCVLAAFTARCGQRAATTHQHFGDVRVVKEAPLVRLFPWVIHGWEWIGLEAKTRALASSELAAAEPFADAVAVEDGFKECSSATFFDDERMVGVAAFAAPACAKGPERKLGSDVQCCE